MAVPKWPGILRVLSAIFPSVPPRMASTLKAEVSSCDIWRLERPCSAHSISGHALPRLASALGVGFMPGVFPTHEGSVGTEGCLQQPGPCL